MNVPDLFPFDDVRPIQEEMMSIITECLEEGTSAILHAPTGLGKTAASLSPALAYAKAHGMIVFFLTSRHTQHRIAVDTLKQIRKKHGKDVVVADITGKQTMCLVDNVHTLLSSDFTDYCKTVREDRTCSFYTKATNKGSLSVKARPLVEHLISQGPFHSEEVVSLCRDEKLCPYEVLIHAAKEAEVIVADYYYVFNKNILDVFLAKIGKELSKSIIIIDEGHNLGGRVRELNTARISGHMVSRARKEAQKYGFHDAAATLDIIGESLYDLGERLEISAERLVTRSEFIASIGDAYDTIIEDLEEAGDKVLLEQKRSSIAQVARFLASWKGEDEGYARIAQSVSGNQHPSISLQYRCLDPSLVTRDIINSAHSTILMSGTLTPTSMYAELLGFPPGTEEREFQSPFPKKNRLNLIIPKTTTKYASRSPEQFRKIAMFCAGISNTVPGNVALFFPSYMIRDQVMESFQRLSEKTIFSEVPQLSKEEKKDLIDRFKGYYKTGAVLTGVASGSFGEGIDLPGDLLKAVVVIGLPLKVPDLETKELIKYYDLKFRKGWDYGYVLPAITKTMQNAGRCIRSETDKGVIVFLEERYSYPRYLRCFPKEWDIQVSLDFQSKIRSFFRIP